MNNERRFRVQTSDGTVVWEGITAGVIKAFDKARAAAKGALDNVDLTCTEFAGKTQVMKHTIEAIEAIEST